jgi:hypothetical protein
MPPRPAARKRATKKNPLAGPYGNRGTKGEYAKIVNAIAAANRTFADAAQHFSLKRVNSGRAYKRSNEFGGRPNQPRKLTTPAQYAHRARFKRLAESGILRQVAAAARAGMPKEQRRVLLATLEAGPPQHAPMNDSSFSGRRRVREEHEVPRRVVRAIEREGDVQAMNELAIIPMNS